LHLIRTNAEREALAARYSSFDHPTLNAVNLSVSIIIAAYQGLKPTSGYRINIVAVAASGKVLEVTVNCSSPMPGELVRQGFETPYHLVQVERSSFAGSHFTKYRLCDELGKTLEYGPIIPIVASGSQGAMQ
jgi:hypothetical protein